VDRADGEQDRDPAALLVDADVGDDHDAGTGADVLDRLVAEPRAPPRARPGPSATGKVASTACTAKGMVRVEHDALQPVRVEEERPELEQPRPPRALGEDRLRGPSRVRRLMTSDSR
jgi:hypothetical protein